MLPARRTRRVSKRDADVGVDPDAAGLPEVGASSASPVAFENLTPVTRPGYPVITDPQHPLWDAQQNLWDEYSPWEAQRALVEHSNKHQRRANSTSHPAFRSDYIKNDLATREVVESPPREAPPKDRR